MGFEGFKAAKPVQVTPEKAEEVRTPLSKEFMGGGELGQLLAELPPQQLEKVRQVYFLFDDLSPGELSSIESTGDGVISVQSLYERIVRSVEYGTPLELRSKPEVIALKNELIALTGESYEMRRAA